MDNGETPEECICSLDSDNDNHTVNGPSNVAEKSDNDDICNHVSSNIGTEEKFSDSGYIVQDGTNVVHNQNFEEPPGLDEKSNGGNDDSNNSNDLELLFVKMKNYLENDNVETNFLSPLDNPVKKSCYNFYSYIKEDREKNICEIQNLRERQEKHCIHTIPHLRQNLNDIKKLIIKINGHSSGSVLLKLIQTHNLLINCMEHFKRETEQAKTESERNRNLLTLAERKFRILKSEFLYFQNAIKIIVEEKDGARYSNCIMYKIKKIDLEFENFINKQAENIEDNLPWSLKFSNIKNLENAELYTGPWDLQVDKVKLAEAVNSFTFLDRNISEKISIFFSALKMTGSYTESEIELIEKNIVTTLLVYLDINKQIVSFKDDIYAIFDEKNNLRKLESELEEKEQELIICKNAIKSFDQSCKSISEENLKMQSDIIELIDYYKGLFENFNDDNICFMKIIRPDEIIGKISELLGQLYSKQKKMKSEIENASLHCDYKEDEKLVYAEQIKTSLERQLAEFSNFKSEFESNVIQFEAVLDVANKAAGFNEQSKSELLDILKELKIYSERILFLYKEIYNENLTYTCKNELTENEAPESIQSCEGSKSNVDLLKDMLQMNLVLRERGEMISDLNRKLKQSESFRQDIIGVHEFNLSLLRDKVNKNELRYQIVSEENKQLKENLAKRISELEESRQSQNTLQNDMETQMEIKINELIEHYEEELQKYSTEKEYLQSSVTSLQNQLQEKDAAFSELEYNSTLHEGLKTRIEDLTRKYEKEFENFSSEKRDLELIVADLQKRLQEKDAAISAMELDLGNQKEIADGDTSSMGTISKSEENNRLRDVEDSFEERYHKLRGLAVKMRTKMADLSNQLHTERANSDELRKQLEHLKPEEKFCEKLQQDCDDLNGKLKALQHELSERESMLERNASLISQYENDSISLNEQIKIMQDQQTKEKLSLESEIAELAKNNKEKNLEIESYKQTINKKVENLKKIQIDLEQAKLEARKQGALTLEMRDYEKTISDLTSKLSSEKDRVSDLNQQLNKLTKANGDLLQHMKQLEDDLSFSKTSNQHANEEILSLNKKLSNLEAIVNEREIHLQEISENNRLEKIQMSEQIAQYAETASENLNLMGNYQKIEETLTRQVNTLKMELNVCQDSLKKKEFEFSKLNEDFENYKTRAQNALQKYKCERVNKFNEDRMQEDIKSLETTVENFKKQLTDLQNELDARKTDLKLSEMEKDKLVKKNRELNGMVAEKLNHLEFAHEQLKKYKTDAETQLIALQNQIENSSLELHEMKTLKQELEDSKIELENTKIKLNNLIQQQQISFDQLESRSQEEEHPTLLRKVSAGADSSSFCNETMLVPLEELLSSDNNQRQRNTSLSGRDNRESKSVEYDYQKQVEHLTTMLNESELNSERNEQQIQVLKEEFRRMQRSVERQPHIQNTEYLKNILFKFLVLQSSDERSRLVPVLETMLKLSSEESKQLSSIAKGNVSSENWSSWNNFWK